MRKINDMELIAVIPEGPSIVDELTIDERYRRSRDCVDACATLNNPRHDISELVCAAREVLKQNHMLPIALQKLSETLSKFEGVK